MANNYYSILSGALLVCVLTMTRNPKLVNAERMFPGNPYSHREVLDREGNVLLEWIADPKKSDVVFNITAKTRGYLALGFSKTGKMAKSDMLIGGVGRGGVPYLSDRHTLNERIPSEDLQQDWKLLRAWENSTHTSLRVMRSVETCDPQDFPINDDTMHILWAYGENDLIDYHLNRGSFQTNLMQPDLTPKVPTPPTSQKSPVRTGLDVWRLTVGVNRDSTASKFDRPWCVFQRGPELEKKHHIIGFSTVKSDVVHRNLDRLVLYKCSSKLPNANPGGNAEESERKFYQFVDYSGECANATDLFPYCNDIIYTWGKGGKDVFLPKDTGIPFGVEDEYYLLETYFIKPSPNTTENQQINVDIDLLLTDSPRKYEAKILRIGHNPKSPLFIPPGSLKFDVYGHCVSDCTERKIPKRKAMRVFGVSFDTGQSGKSVTLHQTRNAHQIPLIMEDGNHDPSFQQMLILREETPVRAGDQLTVRCTFDSTIRSSISSPKTSLSVGTSSKYPPRCLAYLWYFADINGTSASNKYPNYPDCTSMILPSDIAKWIEQNTPKEARRNLNLTNQQNKLNTMKWTPQLRLSFHHLYKFGKYRTSCGTIPAQLDLIDTNKQTSSNTNNRNGTSSKAPVSSAAANGGVTVYPLPVEQIPYTIGCPTLQAGLPVLFGFPGPVILGFP